jgi:hypothetical protein
MSQEESSRKNTTRLLTTAAISYLRHKYFHKTVAMFSEVEVASNLRVDVLCLTYNDEVTVFEIKSCKEDFKTDRKWQKYLNYCNYFYFITTDGAIKPSDLPEGVGLIYFINEENQKKSYNLIRESSRFKGLGLTNKWFKNMYKKLAFRVSSEDGLFNN